MVGLVVDRQDEREVSGLGHALDGSSCARRPPRRAARAESPWRLVQVVAAAGQRRAASSRTPQRTSRQPSPRSAIDLGDERAEAAGRVVRLDRERERRRSASSSARSSTGDGLQRATTTATVASMPRAAEQLGGLDAPRAAIVPERDERDVAPSPIVLGAAEREAPVEPGATGVVVLAERGSRRARAAPRSRASAARVCAGSAGATTVMPGCTRISADVLERVVGDAVVAVVEPAADADDAHRQLVQRPGRCG